MSRHSLSKFLSVITLFTMILAFAMAAQARPATEQGAVPAGAPGTPPSLTERLTAQAKAKFQHRKIDARPLMDKQPIRHSAVQQPVGSGPAGAGTPLRSVKQPNANRPAPTHSGKGTLQVRGAAQPGQAAGATAPSQLAASCIRPLVNSGLTSGTGWYDYASPPQSVAYVTEAYYSAPHSFKMIDGVGHAYFDTQSGTTRYYSQFGQDFIFPTGGDGYEIDLQMVGRNMGDPNDYSYVSLYQVDDATGNLGTLIDYLELSPWVSATNWDGIIITGAQPGLGGQHVAVVVETDTNNIAPLQTVWVDDVEMTICNTTTVPSGKIAGRITGGSARLDDAVMVLAYTQNPSNPASEAEIIDATYAKADGSYEFKNLGALTNGDQLQVWFLNDDNNPTRLTAATSAEITSFNGTQILTVPLITVADIPLVGPASQIQTTLPVTFSWSSGNRTTGDVYTVCLYDVQDTDKLACTQAVHGLTSQVTLAMLQADPDLQFTYGRDYGWFVGLAWNDGFGGVDLGFSYGTGRINFQTTLDTPPSGPITPGGSVPTAGTKPWTVLIYIAADNNLGTSSNPNSNLKKQWEQLKVQAANYPNVNIVTLIDFYGNTGTQFCNLKAGTPSCEEWGEQDTSNPAVLTRFINTGLQRFPSTHTMLIISDHGHGIVGVAADDTAANGSHRRDAAMTPDKVRLALKNAGLGTTKSKLDVLFYNNCLMGTLETAYDAAPFANYMVASSNEIWVLPVYNAVLGLLTPTVTPRNVASGIVTKYRDTVNAIAPGRFISSAAFDLSKVAPVSAAVSGLAQAMDDNMATDRAAIDTVRSQVQVYDSSGDGKLGSEDAFVDLRDLAARTVAASFSTASSGTIHNAAQNLLNVLGPKGGNASLIINSIQQSGLGIRGQVTFGSNATGPAVYFPNGSADGDQTTLTQMYTNDIFAEYRATTQWDEFVSLYTSNVLEGGPYGIARGLRPVDGSLPPALNNHVYLPMVRK